MVKQIWNLENLLNTKSGEILTNIPTKKSVLGLDLEKQKK